MLYLCYRRGFRKPAFCWVASSTSARWYGEVWAGVGCGVRFGSNFQQTVPHLRGVSPGRACQSFVRTGDCGYPNRKAWVCFIQGLCFQVEFSACTGSRGRREGVLLKPEVLEQPTSFETWDQPLQKFCLVLSCLTPRSSEERPPA